MTGGGGVPENALPVSHFHMSVCVQQRGRKEGGGGGRRPVLELSLELCDGRGAPLLSSTKAVKKLLAGKRQEAELRARGRRAVNIGVVGGGGGCPGTVNT